MYHSFHHHHLYFAPTPSSFDYPELLSLLANVVTILGVIGLILAYREYKDKQKEEKRKKLTETIRAVRSVKYQLDVIGKWSGFKAGGYKKQEQNNWVKTQLRRVGNPFNLIYKIDYSSLESLSVLPAIESFSDDVNEAIAWVKQWASSFNNMLDDIKKFSYSRSANKNIILHLKLNKAVAVKLNLEEERFVTKLLEMNTILHFQIIGDETTMTLHYWHKRLKELLDKLENETMRKLKELE